MDTTSKNVSDLYKKFPYPFPSSQIKNVNELLNLFKIFRRVRRIRYLNRLYVTRLIELTGSQCMIVKN